VTCYYFYIWDEFWGPGFCCRLAASAHCP